MLKGTLLASLLASRPVAGAADLVARGGGFVVHRTKTSVPKAPRDDASRNRGPMDRGTTYGQNELFHTVQRSDGAEGIVWQEFGNYMVGKPIFITWFSADKESAVTTGITDDAHKPWLAGACTIGNGNIMYMEVEDVSQWLSNSLMVGWTIGADEKSDAWMVEYDPVQGKEVSRDKLDTGAIDLFDFAEQRANLRYNARENTVGVTFSHLIGAAIDGNNHQQGSAFVWEVANHRWMPSQASQRTGGHSLQQSLIASDSDGFLGVGFYDNSPRGIQLFRLGSPYFQLGWTVYNVKTNHGASKTNPSNVEYDKYSEISSPGKTFYKWSNDNQVYGELAMPGAVETEDAILVFFTGEPPTQGESSLDNSVFDPKVEEVVQRPRNLGWIKVGKSLAEKKVLSQGGVEDGGFYGFWGDWKAQSNQGINWLTDYKEKWLIMAKPKSVRLAPNRILLMWEQWHARGMTKEDCDRLGGDTDLCKWAVDPEQNPGGETLERFVRTEMMIVDDEVNVVKPLWSWQGGLVTPQGDAPRVVDGCAVIYVGRGHEIHRYKVCEENACSEQPSGEQPTDDLCFEPFPPEPWKCEDGPDAGPHGPTSCGGTWDNYECKPLGCPYAGAFCHFDTVKEACPKTCGVCDPADDTEYTGEQLELIDFLLSDECPIGSKQYGVHQDGLPPKPPCSDTGKAPRWRGSEQLSCEEAQRLMDLCNRPAVDEKGKTNTDAAQMAESCQKTCSLCSEGYPMPAADAVQCSGPAPTPAPPSLAPPAPAPPPQLGAPDAAVVDGAGRPHSSRLVAAAAATCAAALLPLA